MDTREYYAHTRNEDRELLREHLKLVSERAAGFASAFGAEQQARVAGLLHDLGKYADQFQRRLEGHEKGKDHSSAGSYIAAKCYKHLGAYPSLAIDGHHGGMEKLHSWKHIGCEKQKLFDHDRKESPHRRKTTESDIKLLLKRFEGEGFSLPKVSDGVNFSDEYQCADMLDVRMLFSALVDADFIETESYMQGDEACDRRYRKEGDLLNHQKAWQRLQKYMAKLPKADNPHDPVQIMRDTLWDSCVAKGGEQVQAGSSAGVYTLSAPTGAGKTLAMLAFALQQARQRGLRRIIVVMPYLSIIEQTAGIYRDIFSTSHGFSEQFVIEDHSNVQHDLVDDPEEQADSVTTEKKIGRLLAENWDAPIILTTSVQCLESLMSNRPGACRKLHRMAKSAILFDEVQTLPPELAVPTLATLSHLSTRYDSTVLFATATQPAFDHLHEQVKKYAPTGWEPKEIIPDEQMQELYAPASKRVQVTWSHAEPTAWNDLAARVAEYDQVLCVVNMKRHAQQLTQLLIDGGCDAVLHLSTNMCTAHRQKVLKEVRTRLETNEPVRLIATQCVEAGVDIDFPVVYRAMGPLDSIAQAAGRCNRHGHRPSPGQVHVFTPDVDTKTLYPPGVYRQAAEATRLFLKKLVSAGYSLEDIEILSEPERLRAYYKDFYKLSNCTDPDAKLRLALDEWDFHAVACAYRLIPADTVTVLVPYGKAVYQQLLDELDQADPRTPDFIRDWTRRARPYTVGQYRRDADHPMWQHLEPIQFSRRTIVDHREGRWFYCDPYVEYDPLHGLVFQDELEMVV